MIHNKAIRDKIPEIIEKSGSKCNVKTLSDSEFLEKLEGKLSVDAGASRTTRRSRARTPVKRSSTGRVPCANARHTMTSPKRVAATRPAKPFSAR